MWFVFPYRLRVDGTDGGPGSDATPLRATEALLLPPSFSHALQNRRDGVGRAFEPRDNTVVKLVI
jgi:hypothetical protein